MRISEEAIYVDGRAKTARTKRAAYETTEELEAVLNRYVPEGEKSQFVRKAIAAALADVLPPEPLIEDEKVRKAVRAWAEVNSIKEAMYAERPDRSLCLLVDMGDDDYNIDFVGWIPTLKDGKSYTIAELCGEEEWTD